MVSMATIRTNDHAPAETAKYILPTATFDLGPGDEYTTNDSVALSDASVHPWLEVEYPPAEELSVTPVDPHVPREDDPFTSLNDISNDPEAVRAAQEAAAGVAVAPVAVDSGLDQDKVKRVKPVDVTLAAAEKTASDSEPKGSDKKEG